MLWILIFFFLTTLNCVHGLEDECTKGENVVCFKFEQNYATGKWDPNSNCKAPSHIHDIDFQDKCTIFLRGVMTVDKKTRIDWTLIINPKKTRASYTHIKVGPRQDNLKSMDRMALFEGGMNPEIYLYYESYISIDGQKVKANDTFQVGGFRRKGNQATWTDVYYEHKYESDVLFVARPSPDCGPIIKINMAEEPFFLVVQIDEPQVREPNDSIEDYSNIFTKKVGFWGSIHKQPPPPPEGKCLDDPNSIAVREAASAGNCPNFRLLMIIAVTLIQLSL